MSVTAIRHIDFEDLGLAKPLLGNIELDTTYVNARKLDEQAVEPADMLVIFGGPISVSDEADTNRHRSAPRAPAVAVVQRGFAEIGRNP